MTILNRRLTELLYEEDDYLESYKNWYRRPRMTAKAYLWTSKEEYEKERKLPTVDLEQLVRDCYICMSWLSERLNSWEIYDYVISMTGVHVNDGHE